MRKSLALLIVCLLIAMSVGIVSGQDEPSEMAPKNARVFRSSGGRSLTLPSQNSPASTVSNFLRSQQRGEETLNSIVVRSEGRDTRAGLTHLRMEQSMFGLKVYGAYVKAAVNNRGELIHLIENLATVPAGGLRQASISDSDALAASLNALYPGFRMGLVRERTDGNTVTFSNNGFFHRNPTVTRVAIPMDNGSIHEGFLVETWSDRGNLLHHTLVGRRGQILSVELRTNADSYNIFLDHPGNSSQTVRSGPGTGNAESPDGWLSGSQTTHNITGNNVHAYLDTDANNAPDAGGTTVNDGNFLTAANLSQDPSTTQNKAVAVQNLFYFNNVIHDKLYHHGFTEAVGNFQENNFGNGGSGSDSVDAEAQDGSGLNNANFATPSDGSNPRMQMYLWNQSNPRRDGDVDSDIIWHEYGHGLTWRMIGNMSGPMSGAIGEGMSDVLAILINNNDRVGEYSFNDPLGIRSAPYTNYPRTYGDFTGSSVHFDGEIYAATIWRLWQLFDQNAISQDTLFDYLIGGMNFTPSGPAMEDMRDGILAAAAGSGHECFIWEAFAHFGIGVGAKGQIKGGGPFGGGKVTITQSFAVPSECTAEPPPPPPPGDTMHLGNLTGSSELANRGRWNATVTVTVHSSGHAPVEGATVSGSWSGGASGSGSCVTDASGQCSISKNNNKSNVGSVSFTVNDLTHTSFTYNSGNNHAPTSVTINQP